MDVDDDLIVDDDLMMDVADSNDLMPPLLPDVATSSRKSRKLIEACQANLKRTGRKLGEVNKERNAQQPNCSREACPGSMNNLQRKGRVKGSKNKEKPPKPPKPPGFNPNQKRDEANLKKKKKKRRPRKGEKDRFEDESEKKLRNRYQKFTLLCIRGSFSRLTICIIRDSQSHKCK